MRLSLHSHPSSLVSGVDEFWVTYSWVQNSSLWIRYTLEGALDNLHLPEKADPNRADGLWESTCFELFLREPSSNTYCEFNFSPSGRWSAYQFSGYREGMTNLELPKRPEIILDSSDAHVALEVTLDLPDSGRDSGRDRGRGNNLNAAFSAVIADNCGSKSYWALSHPPGNPDFHHKDGFTHQLKAADCL